MIPEPINPLPKLTIKGESSAFNVSVRGWAFILIIATGCYMSIAQIKIEEPFYSLILLVAGFYFGQKNKEGQTK